ncbi:MAG: hypothetical protein ABII22_00835 [Candidatus Micrarchaeota archaeon]
MVNFTVDALFAVLIAIIFLFAIGGFISETDKFQDSYVINDILIVLDKQNTLSTFDSATINNSLDILLDANYRLEITTYNATSFALLRNMAIGQNLPQINDYEIMTADRYFVQSAGNRIQNLSKARLYAWR